MYMYPDRLAPLFDSSRSACSRDKFVFVVKNGEEPCGATRSIASCACPTLPYLSRPSSTASHPFQSRPTNAGFLTSSRCTIALACTGNFPLRPGKASFHFPSCMAIPRPLSEACSAALCPGHQAAGDEERKGVIIDPDEQQEVPNSKGGMANFLLKFPGDKGPSSLRVLSAEEIKADKKLKVEVRAQTAADTEMVPMIVMECRGMEPVAWHPSGNYVAEAESGTRFEDVKLDQGDDWCEYDEKGGVSMTIGAKIAYEIRRV